MYYTYKVAAMLIRPINGGSDRFTVADCEMTFTKEWHPQDPATNDRVASIVEHAFCELSETGDFLSCSMIGIKLAEEFIS